MGLYVSKALVQCWEAASCCDPYIVGEEIPQRVEIVVFPVNEMTREETIHPIPKSESTSNLVIIDSYVQNSL